MFATQIKAVIIYSLTRKKVLLHKWYDRYVTCETEVYRVSCTFRWEVHEVG